MWDLPKREKRGYQDTMMLMEIGWQGTGKMYASQDLGVYGSLATGGRKAAGFPDTGDRFACKEKNSRPKDVISHIEIKEGTHGS